MSGPNLTPVGQDPDLDDLLAAGVVPNAAVLEVSGGVGFAYGEVGYIHTDETVLKAKSNGTLLEADAYVICLDPAGVASGSSGMFGFPGCLVPGLTGGSAGVRGFLSATAGAITTVVPTTNYSKCLGRWQSTEVFHFLPDWSTKKLS